MNLEGKLIGNRYEIQEIILNYGDAENGYTKSHTLRSVDCLLERFLKPSHCMKCLTSL